VIRENKREVASGYLLLVVLFVVHAAASFWMVTSIVSEVVFNIVVSAVVWSLIFVFWPGFFIVNPNEARVLQLFGKYVGTVKAPGLRWANPFYSKHKISLRVRNFETGKLKVNDANSNPIEIGCVVVWKVVDTAEAMFEVDDYVNYVHVQSEAAVRNLATDYPYDAHDHGDVALSSHTSQISEQLKGEVQARLEKAGVEVIEARISHLAYSPEIAHAMLQRQQASAVVAARTKIVEGAVGMVDLALDYLSKRDIIELDEERKAAMVSNLLVVLCSDRGTQPVVNTGSIYQ
jgi:regulator of protease activity HflC (stomatin/prohibitin superfamily)